MAFVITAVIMIFVIPAFKSVFASFGADLPGPTLVVMAISDFFVEYWYAIFGVIGGGIYGFFWTWKRSVKMQIFMDRVMLRMPVFGDLVRKSSHRALDAHAVHHVRRRRAAGRGARFGGRRLRQLRILTLPPRRSRARSRPAPA